MKKWSENLTALSVKWAGTKRGLLILFLFAFADASFLPLPITTLFIVFAILNITKAYEFAFYSLAGTVAGSMAGYLMGHFAWLDSNGGFTRLAQFMFTTIPGFSEKLNLQVHTMYINQGFWILLLAALTPIPFNFISVLSGVFDVNIFIFFIAVLLSQGIKFYVLAFASEKLGDKIKRLKEFNWSPVVIIFSVFILIAIIFINTIR